jgi:hypothetical protein
MRLVFSNLLKQLEKLCTFDSDSSEIRREKVTLVVITGLWTLASIIWDAIYYALLGATTTTYITFGFTVIVGIALFIFLITKRFSPFLYVFFFMILEPDCDAMEFGRICRLWSFDAVVPFSSI